MNNKGDLEFPAVNENSFASSDLANIWNVIKNGGGGNTPPMVFQVVGVGGTAQQIIFDMATATAGLPVGKMFKMSILGLQFDHTGATPFVPTPIDFFYVFNIAPMSANGLIGSITNTLDNEVTRCNSNPITKVNFSARDNPASITLANLTGAIPDLIFTTPILAFFPFMIFINPAQGSFVFPQKSTLSFQIEEVI